MIIKDEILIFKCKYLILKIKNDKKEEKDCCRYHINSFF